MGSVYTCLLYFFQFKTHFDRHKHSALMSIDRIFQRIANMSKFTITYLQNVRPNGIRSAVSAFISWQSWPLAASYGTFTNRKLSVNENLDPEFFVRQCFLGKAGKLCKNWLSKNGWNFSSIFGKFLKSEKPFSIFNSFLVEGFGSVNK